MSMNRGELRRVFSMFDRNDDGKISQKELSESMEKLGVDVPEKELSQMIEKIDANGDGCVEAEEFGALYTSVMEDDSRGSEEDEMWNRLIPDPLIKTALINEEEGVVLEVRRIMRCRPFQILTKGGRLFFDGCYLRYDNYMFFNESLSSENRTVCGGDDFGGNRTQFRSNVVELGRNLRVEGVKNEGFFTGFLSSGNLTVYGLAQCWEFVNGSDCVNCLENVVSRIEFYRWVGYKSVLNPTQVYQ